MSIEPELAHIHRRVETLFQEHSAQLQGACLMSPFTRKEAGTVDADTSPYVVAILNFLCAEAQGVFEPDELRKPDVRRKAWAVLHAAEQQINNVRLRPHIYDAREAMATSSVLLEHAFPPESEENLLSGPEPGSFRNSSLLIAKLRNDIDRHTRHLAQHPDQIVMVFGLFSAAKALETTQRLSAEVQSVRWRIGLAILRWSRPDAPKAFDPSAQATLLSLVRSLEAPDFTGPRPAPFTLFEAASYQVVLDKASACLSELLRELQNHAQSPQSRRQHVQSEMPDMLAPELQNLLKLLSAIETLHVKVGKDASLSDGQHAYLQHIVSQLRTQERAVAPYVKGDIAITQDNWLKAAELMGEAAIRARLVLDCNQLFPTMFYRQLPVSMTERHLPSGPAHRRQIAQRLRLGRQARQSDVFDRL